jgi:hypothetical protein
MSHITRKLPPCRSARAAHSARERADRHATICAPLSASH